uniref:Uncharacterized protein n=1 Tax=Molossus molossus TaxID=27622 RepID=A0A7J8CZF6_MOLMO|nr:hypothetical protein HJG59_009446 [Molossus molossus]
MREHRLAASCMPLTRDQAHNLGMCPDQESNRRPLGAWVDAQPPSHIGRAHRSILILLFEGRLSAWDHIMPELCQTFTWSLAGVRSVIGAPTSSVSLSTLTCFHVQSYFLVYLRLEVSTCSEKGQLQSSWKQEVQGS